MAKIVECIPNFSEGRSQLVLDALLAAAGEVPGVLLLDHTADASHNRCVLTLAGSPDGVAEAAFRLCAVAAQHIDLTRHRGEHPRMGAADVIPFVPVQDVTMAECVALAQQVGARIGSELAIPVFLYEDATGAEHRRNLADVRRGEFEGLAGKLASPGWQPDYGPATPHPTAGAVAVGARRPLVAFNVNLHTDNVEIAKAIAKAVRGSSGGYRWCKAMGVQLVDAHGKNIAQVSMNLVHYEATPIYRVFEAIKAEAARWGVQVAGSELIGLAPARAFVDCAAYYLQLQDYDYDGQVLERRLAQLME